MESTSREQGPTKHLTGAPDLFAGTHYRAVSRIGTGGMGEVFVVEHKCGTDDDCPDGRTCSSTSPKYCK